MADAAARVAPAGAATRDGLVTLGPDALALRAALDARFESWGRQEGAVPMAYPPLLTVPDLTRVDYFANFPHLAMLAGGIGPETLDSGYPGDARPEAVPGELLTPAVHVLPPAACYSVYFDLAGERLAEGPRRVTTVATCFRREDHFDGLRRLLGFTMREIVCVGDRDSVLAHLAHFKARVLEFLKDIGLPIEVQTATDPFFDPNGARALSQKLFPVKEEFTYGGSLAIASANFHRNFFGERCDIRTADGEQAFTGCVAFGLERWLSALGDHFGAGPGALLERIGDVG
jgi:tRNA synthetase class II core domain (G, H, P, S and T)